MLPDMQTDSTTAETRTATYQQTRNIFLCAVGGIYLVAFASLWVQVDGLIGVGGILPVRNYLEAVAGQTGHERYWFVPTLCWFSSSNAFLHVQCGLGVLCSVLVIARRARGCALVLSWLLYLSLTTAGQKFLGYQWDNLLLEAGFLSIWMAPCRLWKERGQESPPPRLAVFLLRVLLFKLMFSSGVVKLSSGDETWHNLTALTYHYETQPLPTWIAWYLHQLPGWFHKVSCAMMFSIELVVPFFIFGPRHARYGAFAALVFLQLLIIGSGNYTFFNWLTITLCLLLLDDNVWPWARGESNPEFAAETVVPPRSSRWVTWALSPFAAVILLLNMVEVVGTFRRPVSWPRPVGVLYRWVSPLRSVNSYGLFAVMTTDRPEIVIEGSMDGNNWEPYEFKWKAGDLTERPRFVAPHQPRLDWQMWFGALGNYQGNPWFMNLLVRLFEGKPEVLSLLARNPFPEEPPRYLRALLYNYTFTDWATRRAQGTWWNRELRGLYCPVVERRDR